MCYEYTTYQYIEHAAWSYSLLLLLLKSQMHVDYSVIPLLAWTDGLVVEMKGYVEGYKVVRLSTVFFWSILVSIPTFLKEKLSVFDGIDSLFGHSHGPLSCCCGRFGDRHCVSSVCLIRKMSPCL